MQENTTLAATLKEVSQFTASLEVKFKAFDTETRTLVILGLQELLVNIVEHAFSDNSGTITIEINYSGSDLFVTVSDNAKKTFAIPDKISLPDPLDLPEGGMGLFIIHQSFDHVEYKRKSDGNQWQLSKKLG